MLNQLNNWSKLLFWSWTVICDLYLFHFMVLMNTDFSCFKSFVSVSFVKVTTGMYKFVSVIRDSNPVSAIIAEGALSFLQLSLSYQLKHNFLTKLKSTPLRNLLMVCLNSFKSELDVLVEYQLQFYFYLLHHCQLYC